MERGRIAALADFHELGFEVSMAQRPAAFHQVSVSSPCPLLMCQSQFSLLGRLRGLRRLAHVLSLARLALLPGGRVCRFR